MRMSRFDGMISDYEEDNAEQDEDNARLTVNCVRGYLAVKHNSKIGRSKEQVINQFQGIRDTSNDQ